LANALAKPMRMGWDWEPAEYLPLAATVRPVVSQTDSLQDLVTVVMLKQPQAPESVSATVL
jgi:hypothetical protein